MTPEELDAIEARANAATPGPWEWTRPEFSPSSDCHVLLSSSTTISYGQTARIEVHSDGSAYGEYNPDIDVNGPDATFIAHARTDIPALVARVRELEAERDERTRQHAARGVEAVAVIDELRATLANERRLIALECAKRAREMVEAAKKRRAYGDEGGALYVEGADAVLTQAYFQIESGSFVSAETRERAADLARGAT